MKYIIYWTAYVKSNKLWSSQLWTQFLQLRIEAWKIQDFNGVWTCEWPAPKVSGFIAQLGTGIARSRVQTPLKSWIFQASIRNCKNLVSNCENHSLLDFTSAAQYMKHFIYNCTNTFALLLTSPVIVSSRPEALASVQCNVERVTNKKIIVKNTNNSCLSFCTHFLFVFPFAS